MSKSIGPYTSLLHDMLEAPAWRELSHGAKTLYVELKKRSSWAGNRAYLPYRMAMHQLKASTRKVREWFAELEHYGFIVLAVPGSLGVDGKGKAPHWRLTEKGIAKQELPTKDYLRWTGELFDPTPFRDETKTKPRYRCRLRTVPDVGDTTVTDTVTPESRSVTDDGNIQVNRTVTDVGTITRLTSVVPVCLSSTNTRLHHPDARLQTSFMKRRPQ